jgi:lysophospholipase L1-like esterase
MATETCVKGQVKASEVVFIGTSVIAAGKIPQDTSDRARMAGVIDANESYRSKAVVGAQIIPDSTSPIEGIPSQFMSAIKEGPVKVVLMEGGINDLLWGGRCKNGDDDAPCMELVATVKKLFMTMQQSGVQDVVYFFYPDPGTFMGQDVKAATNTLRPKMQKVCEEATEVRCVFADPRPAWQGHYDKFTSDGIHPTDAGSEATAKVVWDAMVANCVAQ